MATLNKVVKFRLIKMQLGWTVKSALRRFT